MKSHRGFVRVTVARFVIAFTLALLLVVSGLVAVNVIIDNKINSIERVQLDTAPDTSPGEPANFLLIGSDTRAFIDEPTEVEAFGDPTVETGQRSDTLMVVHVDPERRSGYVVSFPRDLLVEIPGMGREKINAAYNAGEQAVIDTVQTNFNIKIHHYLEVNFDSFKGIVDAIGGVRVYFPAPARDEDLGFEFAFYGFEPGCYVLDGSNALLYVRSRKYEQLVDNEWVPDARDDFGRIDRQQTFMRQLAVQALKKGIADPLSANKIADKAIAQLRVDDALDRSDINKLINAFRDIDPSLRSIEMTTIPWLPDPDAPRSNLIVQQPEAESVLARLRDDGTRKPDQDRPPPSAIRVRVFNGSGVEGAAAQTSEKLQQLGFARGGIGDNPGGSIATSEIRYGRGAIDKARVVQESTGGVGRLIEDSAVVDADVVLVLGRDFQGVASSPDGELGAAEGSPASSTSGSAGAAAAPGTSPTRDPIEC